MAGRSVSPARHSGGRIDLRIEDPDREDIRALLDEGSAFMASLYPSESNYMLDVAALQRPEVTFVVARDADEVLGCGALVLSNEGWAELKRMYVAPRARGRKLGRRLLEQLEAIALTQGATAIRLETGVKQPAAIALYRSSGFGEIGRFGDYPPDPMSVFMEKVLAGKPSFSSRP